MKPDPKLRLTASSGTSNSRPSNSSKKRRNSSGMPGMPSARGRRRGCSVLALATALGCAVMLTTAGRTLLTTPRYEVISAGIWVLAGPWPFRHVVTRTPPSNPAVASETKPIGHRAIVDKPPLKETGRLAHRARTHHTVSRPNRVIVIVTRNAAPIDHLGLMRRPLNHGLRSVRPRLFYWGWPLFMIRSEPAKVS